MSGTQPFTGLEKRNLLLCVYGGVGVYGMILPRPQVRLEPLAVTTTADGRERQGLKGSG